MPSSYPAGFVKDKTLLPGQGHDWQGHDVAVVTLVVHGRLDERFSCERQSCSSWQLHYKPPGAVHTTSTGPHGARMLLLRIGAEEFRELEETLGARPRPLGGGIRAARALASLLDPACAAAPRPVDSVTVRRLCRELTVEPAAAEKAPPDWIRAIHRRVVARPGRSESLERLARGVGKHPVYVARAFRSHYGATIGAVRRRARVERAIGRLTEHFDELAELALDLGFSDQSHFTREFKRTTGWTPGRFRRAAGRLARLEPAGSRPLGGTGFIPFKNGGPPVNQDRPK